MAWSLITETIVGIGGAAVVTFNNIPQNYRVLWLFQQVRTDDASEQDWVDWRANNDAGNNYDRVHFRSRISGHAGGGGGRAQTEGTSGYCEGANSRANNFGPAIAVWQSYASSTIEKSCLGLHAGIAGDRSADADVMEDKRISWWRNVNPIARLDFFPRTGAVFVQGSKFTLYGIA